MEQQSQETPEEKNRREELFRVIRKIKNTPIQSKANEQGTSISKPTEETNEYSE